MGKKPTAVFIFNITSIQSFYKNTKKRGNLFKDKIKKI
jgi:hypothetical protein